MLNRKIVEFGLPPLVGYVLMAIGFVALSFLMFMKLEMAAYVYGALAIGMVGSLSESKRNDFLKNVYSTIRYRKIRSWENLIVALPFSMYLAFEQAYFISLIVLVLALILAIFQFKQEWDYALPSPFSKAPFEFLIGFRRYFWAYLILWFLVVMGISVGNFNLGVFALLLIFVIAIVYYSKPEETFFVWMYSLSPKAFLWYKIKMAAWHSMILGLPMAVTLAMIYPEKWWIIVFILLIGYSYLVSIILGKYAAFPKPMSVPEGLILMFGVWLPPLLILVIPYFYGKAVKSLSIILSD